MSSSTYTGGAGDRPRRKPLALLDRGLERLDLSRVGRLRLAVLMERLREGEVLAMPESRPMPTIGPSCHELRFRDASRKRHWRLVYRVDPDAVVLVDAFVKAGR
jgi:hypothetical protein